MRGTLPRVRIDQLMGFAWKWLVEIALLNIFVTAGAILVIQELWAAGMRHATACPGWGIAKGMATLVRLFQPKVTVQYPEEVAGDLAPPPRPPDPALRRGRQPQVRDLLPVRAACPIEIIDMGGVDTRDRYHVHWGPPEQYAERREESALRRSGRPVPDRTFEPFAASTSAPLDAHPRSRTTTTRAAC